MINANLISLIHTACVIGRWNDHIRPSTGFTEMDKQAHKTFYAYTLAKCCEKAGGEVDSIKLIEGIIFEFLHRVITTDIKPPVYHKMMKRMGPEINRWVLSRLKDDVYYIKGNFYEKMKEYFLDSEYSAKEKKIIKCAHYLATKWEFDVIYEMNRSMYNIEKTRAEVNRSLLELEWFEGKIEFYQDPGLIDFLNLIGQLRFQQRWTATARMPETSVMGHTLVVALLSYFFASEIDVCPLRLKNAFFGGLFHDLPEVLTRDIISPVKRGIDGFDEMIKSIEDSQMHDVVYPLISEDMQKEINYYTNDEFVSRIIDNGVIKNVSSEEISGNYNFDKYNPIDGRLIRICDHLSAYLEAYLSIKNGVEAQPLKNAINTLYETYKDTKLCGIDVSYYFKYFKDDIKKTTD